MSMGFYSNLILIVVFGVMAAWLLTGAWRTRNLIYKDKLWSVYRILFVIAGGLCLLTGFLYTDLLDIIRLALMTLCVIGFILQRDGIGEEGIAVMGRIIKYEDIRSYDYGDYKKNSFRVYVVQESDPETKVILTLPQDQKEEVIAFLKQKMGKKYTRMKKG